MGRFSPRRLDDLPLFATDAEIGPAVMPPGKGGEWPALAKGLERYGLPKADPVFGGRYIPAVKAFLDKRAGLRQEAVPASVDSEETWT